MCLYLSEINLKTPLILNIIEDVKVPEQQGSFSHGLWLADHSELNLVFLEPTWVRVMQVTPRQDCLTGN